MDVNYSFDEFSFWKVEALRCFLNKRGLPASGTKQELVALCFSAQTLKMPVLPSSMELIKLKNETYNNLLHVDGHVLPDPLSMFEDWEDESQGISHWPPVFITDITTFLMNSIQNTESEEAVRAHLNQYKIGKAYEYYTSNWLKEIFYHPLSATSSSKYCFLRARCTPSMSVNADLHNVWVCCEKTTGNIKSAYCSCTSGLGQTCNHVAGLLFRIEDANKLGVTSCTSAACVWLKPSEKKLEPAQLKQMNFKKSVHGKTRTRPLVGQNKTTYDALPQPQNSIRQTQEKIIDSLKEVLPNACFLKGFPNSAADKPTLPKLKVTTPLLDVDTFTIDNMVKQNLQTLTDAEVESVNQITKGQSSNPQWLSLRKGRITASNLYTVFTKVESIKKKTECDSKSLLSKIMGYKIINPNIKSLKYGREMEPVAKTEFIKMYTKEHTNVKFVECGLFIDKARPYMAASPDLLVSCSCCGEGLAEFKCPLISKCTACASFCTCNLPTCLSNNKPHTLKHGSYYSQIQGQLDITKRKWCVFYIYTCNGPFFETITFDNEFYSNILVNIEYFFTNLVKPEIYSRALQNSLQHVDTDEPMEIDSPTKGNTYFCPKCNFEISNNVIELKHRSISCDSCKLWYHFHCVGVTSKNVQNVSSWCCKKCL